MPRGGCKEASVGWFSLNLGARGKLIEVGKGIKQTPVGNYLGSPVSLSCLRNLKTAPTTDLLV